jgi:N-acetylglucosamine kinase-like BadF-type ATPase
MSADATRLYVGVDGGGSKTRALVGDAAGLVLGIGESRSSNPKAVGFDAATAAILAATSEALERAAVRGPVAAAALGLAGLDREEDRARILGWLEREGLAHKNAVVQDTSIVLLAAGSTRGEQAGDVATDEGIALICGTGAVCHGIARGGVHVRAGGWGYLLGDEGSGYDVALRALRLATQTADGRADARGVLDAALAHFGCARAEDLLASVYADEVTRSTIAALAARVVSIAEAGDPHACALVRSVAADAAGLLVAVAARLGDRPGPIAFAGGLLTGSTVYRDAVVAAAAQRGVANAHLAVVVRDPAEGALALARRIDAS